jgi:hypothetical protein
MRSAIEPTVWKRSYGRRSGPGGGGCSVADTPEGGDRQRFLDRCFEFLKHTTTLSTAAALLILAIYREAPFKERLLALTLILFGLCVAVSVFGMLLISLGSGKPRPNQTTWSDETQDAIIRGITTTTGSVFIGSVGAFALSFLAVPFWHGLWILLALMGLLVGALLFIRRRRKRQPSNDK